MYSLNNISLSENWIYLFLLGLRKRRPSYRRSHESLHEYIQYFKTWNFKFLNLFLLLWVIFYLLDPDLDPADQNQWIHADPDWNIAFLTVYGLPRHILPDRKAAWSRSPSGRRSGSIRLLQEDRPPVYTVKVLHLIQRSLSIVNYRRSFTTVRMIVNQNLTDHPTIITLKQLQV